jgi:small-conductance mechanosensitive channel/CRP-like cAMP-binding protein
VDLRLIDLVRGVPALVLLVTAVLVIRATVRRPPFRRLVLALCLGALAGSLALFGYLVPAVADGLAPYVQVLVLFTVAYTIFKVVEVVSMDVIAVRRGVTPPPAILRDIVSTVFAVLVLVVLARARMGVDVTALVATSAALSIVLGLALQETLANLFAGMALMIERPFEPGDWIRIGDRVGRIKEVSWRAVKVLIQKQEDYLVIPNSVVAKAEIVNMSQPSLVHGHTVDVSVVQHEAPNRIRRVLVEAALEVPDVLAEPSPFAVVLRFDPFAIVYRLTFYMTDFARSAEIQGAVLAHVWYAFRRHGIQIALPSQVYARDGLVVDTAVKQQEVDRVVGLLRTVDFLTALTPEELEQLARDIRIAPYPAGIVVVREGEAGDSLFVVARGRVQVSALVPHGGPDLPIAVIEAGDYFGEMSLLTGAPRSATVRTLEDCDLLVLSRDTLRPVLVRDPAAAERLTQAMAQRKAEHDQWLKHIMTPGHDHDDTEPPFLLGRMRRFFDLIGGDG